MALIQRKYATYDTAIEGELVDDLAKELTSAADADAPITQPIIIEQEVPDDAIHVIVIWEKWRLITAGRRAEIIHQAYQQAAAERAEQILIATGATTDEAIDLGLLPYEVQPLFRDVEGVSPQQIRDWMKQEGAVETPSGMRLCFPDTESAEKARQRLVSQSSSKHWAIVKYLSND